MPIVLNLINDESIPGTVWITEDRISAGGNPLIEDFLNDEDDMFFSFQSDAGAFRLINKNHITFLETEQRDDEARANTPHEPHSVVTHFSNDQTLYGVMYPTLAEETRGSESAEPTRAVPGPVPPGKENHIQPIGDCLRQRELREFPHARGLSIPLLV